MRVGVYGGSFDPPHAGHLILAADALRNLSLDHLIFVPAATQPFKTDKNGGAPPEARLEMVRLATSGQKSFSVEALEVDRGGLSYTVDTLEELSRRNAGAELFLIVGEDAARELDSWKDPARIRELATVAVLRRHPKGASSPLPDGFVEASGRLVDLSSTEIRERVKAGNSIRGFVTEAVEHYIEANALYR
ncbi:MAG: nicotinate-nucleotide adenylyltransferase [Gemmatimonadota bacterium]|nr:nicotinate-nucleotide adenylyltransferase [Gemmatimonadota bacterium]